MSNAHKPPTDEHPAISSGTVRDRLIAARDVAGRLMLSTPGEGQLRGLFMELITIIVGDERPIHYDLQTSGALFEAPPVGMPVGSVGPKVVYHVTNPAHPPRATSPTLPAPAHVPFQPRPAVGPPARHVPPSTRPLTLDEAARGLRAPAAAPAEDAAPIPIRAKTHDGQPDPEGDQFLESLSQQLTEEEGG